MYARRIINILKTSKSDYCSRWSKAWRILFYFFCQIFDRRKRVGNTVYDKSRFFSFFFSPLFFRTKNTIPVYVCYYYSCWRTHQCWCASEHSYRGASEDNRHYHKSRDTSIFAYYTAASVPVVILVHPRSLAYRGISDGLLRSTVGSELMIFVWQK